MNVVGGAFACGYMCSGLFWFIYGIVYRWGAMGKASTRGALEQEANAAEIAAIDAKSAGADGVEPTAEAEWGLQAKGGAFMNVIVWIGVISAGINLLCCVGALVRMKMQ